MKHTQRPRRRRRGQRKRDAPKVSPTTPPSANAADPKPALRASLCAADNKRRKEATHAAHKDLIDRFGFLDVWSRENSALGFARSVKYIRDVAKRQGLGELSIHSKNPYGNIFATSARAASAYHPGYGREIHTRYPLRHVRKLLVDLQDTAPTARYTPHVPYSVVRTLSIHLGESIRYAHALADFYIYRCPPDTSDAYEEILIAHSDEVAWDRENAQFFKQKNQTYDPRAYPRYPLSED